MDLDKQKLHTVGMSLALMVSTVSLIALGEARIEVYFSIFTVCYFALAGLFRPRRRTFDIVGVILIIEFGMIVTRKILEILY